MKRIYALMATVLLSCTVLPSMEKDNTVKESTTVYICTGPKAKVYHQYKNCKGLRRCSGDIKAVSLDQAKKSRRACRICYK